MYTKKQNEDKIGSYFTFKNINFYKNSKRFKYKHAYSSNYIQTVSLYKITV